MRISIRGRRAAQLSSGISSPCLILHMPIQKARNSQYAMSKVLMFRDIFQLTRGLTCLRSHVRAMREAPPRPLRFLQVR